LDNFSGELIQNGDSVIVNSGEAKIFVTGAVARPGSFLYEPSLSVQQYIASAGGEEWRGNSSNFKIYRNNVEAASTNDVTLQPGDILYIPGRRVMRFNEFVGALVAVATLLIAAKTVGTF
jgi:protein involved in polysaccharide export with SLBB domain